MLTSSQLAAMRQQSIKDIEPQTLVDIRTVSVNENLPPEARMMDYLRQIKNPYFFRCGETTVSVRFSGDTPLAERLKAYFSECK